jgi:cytochrome c2
MSRFLKLFAPSLGGVAMVLGGAYILADQFVVDLPAPMRDRVVPAALAQSDTPAEPPAVESPAGPTLPESVALALGRPATAEEVAAWNIDVRPDGQGLPVGSGDVMTGETLYLDNCASCHGVFGEAEGRWPVLAGGFGSLTNDRPVKTIGSYWPYLSTAVDYVHRAMPFGQPQTLTPDEVYAIVAQILYLNDLVDEDFVLSNETFADVQMPNEDSFFLDDRADGELLAFRADPCMTDCKDSVEITGRAAVVDVTPEDAAARKRLEAAAAAAADAPAQPVLPESPAPDTAAETPAADTPAEPVEVAAVDPDLIAAGEAVFRKCKSCHQVGEGAKNRTGPVLNGVIGRPAGEIEGFRYSGAMEDMAGEGLVWTEANLSDFLANPKSYMKGTKMAFAGLSSDADVEAVIAYLGSFSE